MSRRWKVVLPISGSGLLLMIIQFLNPAAVSTHPLAFSVAADAAGAHPASPPRHYVPRVIATNGAYVVRPGDSLSAIAARLYGNMNAWPVLFWANHRKIGPGAGISPGQVLVVPPLPKVLPRAPVLATPAPPAASQGSGGTPSPASSGPYCVYTQCGHHFLSAAQVGQEWLAAGGPAWAESQSVTVAACESGLDANNWNPSGASGLWQILGQVVPGNIFDPAVNAANAVAKFKASGDTWAQWSCPAVAQKSPATLMAFVAHRRHREPARIRAFEWALTQKGCWYDYGGTSCSPGYDCSGLVQAAYRHAGVFLKRTTYEMLASRKLVRVSHPRKGDLAFFGSGHVELVQFKFSRTFGARDWGLRIQGFRNLWWQPTAYYRVR
jgi:cell wall-associated NlpC family hydrolase